MSTERRLLAIDFSNLIVRHHHSPGGRDHDLAGRPLFGVCGAIRQVLTLIDRERPTHLLIGRDGKREDSFRRAIDPGYKAHRSDADEDLTRQFELAYQALGIMDWPCMSHPGHEADDVIASAARQFPGKVLIVSGDKDLLALCAESITVGLLRAGGTMDRCDTAGCERHLGVRPEQVRDYKSLAGDSSDGIPGVEGIGPKSAVALLTRYGSLAEIYRQADSGEEIDGVAKHFARKVVEGREQARLSWRLAGMVETLPIDPGALAIDGIKRPEDCREELRGIGLGPLLKSAERGPRVEREDPQQALAAVFELL